MSTVTRFGGTLLVVTALIALLAHRPLLVISFNASLPASSSTRLNTVGWSSINKTTGPEELCHIGILKVNRTCPRFVYMDTGTPGLGDQFWKLLVQNIFALDAEATPVMDSANFNQSTRHGNYQWAVSFLNIHVLMKERRQIRADFDNISIVKLSSEETTYTQAVQQVAGQCNTETWLHMNICDGSCYRLARPYLQRFRHIWGCAFLGTDRNALPSLLYDPNWYNVAIHLRLGDIELHRGDLFYFTNMQKELSETLEHFYVHYYFIAEAPDHLDGKPVFDFLPSLFADGVSKVSFLNKMDAHTSLYHFMNADMLVTTGSSFPYIAATISPKPIIVFGRPKGGEFSEGLLRDDFILLEDDGRIIQPASKAESRALVRAKFLEVGRRWFPQDYYRQ